MLLMLTLTEWLATSAATNPATLNIAIRPSNHTNNGEWPCPFPLLV